MAKKSESSSMLLKVILLLTGIVLLFQVYQIWKMNSPQVPNNTFTFPSPAACQGLNKSACTSTNGCSWAAGLNKCINSLY